MGPQDHLRELLDGLGCTVCEERVPAERVRLLARRDDLIFLQVDCLSCGSTSLGFIADEFPPAEADGLDRGPAISADDVLDMHALLEDWTGDLRSLVREAGDRRGKPSRPGHRQAGRPA
jgi:hypothetical protein